MLTWILLDIGIVVFVVCIMILMSPSINVPISHKDRDRARSIRREKAAIKREWQKRAKSYANNGIPIVDYTTPWVED